MFPPQRVRQFDEATLAAAIHYTSGCYVLAIVLLWGSSTKIVQSSHSPSRYDAVHVGSPKWNAATACAGWIRSQPFSSFVSRHSECN